MYATMTDSASLVLLATGTALALVSAYLVRQRAPRPPRAWVGATVVAVLGLLVGWALARPELGLRSGYRAAAEVFPQPIFAEAQSPPPGPEAQAPEPVVPGTDEQGVGATHAPTAVVSPEPESRLPSDDEAGDDPSPPALSSSPSVAPTPSPTPTPSTTPTPSPSPSASPSGTPSPTASASASPPAVAPPPPPQSSP